MGVIHQGKRVLALHEELTPPNNSEDFFRWAESSKAKQSLKSIEEHFFVIAVNKAIEWLLEAEKLSLVERGVSKSFRRTANLATQVRNMREHDLNYFKGNGKRQNAFHAEVPINDIEGFGSVDASSTLVTNEGYLIGGRVSVQAVIAVAEILHSKIKDISIDTNEII